MNKFLILTADDMVNLGVANITNHIHKTGTDGTGIFRFATVPNEFNSKTVYNESEVNSMLRDNTSVFYTEGY